MTILQNVISLRHDLGDGATAVLCSSCWLTVCSCVCAGREVERYKVRSSCLILNAVIAAPMIVEAELIVLHMQYCSQCLSDLPSDAVFCRCVRLRATLAAACRWIHVGPYG